MAFCSTGSASRASPLRKPYPRDNSAPAHRTAWQRRPVLVHDVRRRILCPHRLYRSQRVVARHDQRHMRHVERILRRPQQRFALRGVRRAARFERGAHVLQPEPLRPRRQRRIRLRPADEHHVAMPQHLVVRLEILHDRNLALELVEEPRLKLLGRVAVRARFAIGSVHNDCRRQPSSDIRHQVRRTVARFRGLELRPRLIDERLRRHRLRRVLREVIRH